MWLRENKEVFRSAEFDIWVNRERLIPAERFLIERYLKKEGSTLEAGTGGGRILLGMKEMGFRSLHGFDFVPAFIKQARRKESTDGISFAIQDAVCLGHKDDAFDQIMYLQQILCFIEDETARFKALQEGYRVLKKGGVGIFSFLSYEARSRASRYLLCLLYLGVFRKLRRSTRPIQYLPWLKLGGKLNFGSVLDRGPYTYWYRLEHVERSLTAAGFRTIAIGSTHQINQERMCASYEELARESIQGMIYAVCMK